MGHLGHAPDPEPRHDSRRGVRARRAHRPGRARRGRQRPVHRGDGGVAAVAHGRRVPRHRRSEEHTSELQSLMRISYAVFCLKKKKTVIILQKTKETRKRYEKTKA